MLTARDVFFRLRLGVTLSLLDVVLLFIIKFIKTIVRCVTDMKGFFFYDSVAASRR